MSFVVSLPLQLFKFSNAFPFKTFLRQKTEAATHCKSGSCELGVKLEEAAVLGHAWLIFFLYPGKDGGRSSRGNPKFSTPRGAKWVKTRDIQVELENVVPPHPSGDGGRRNPVAAFLVTTGLGHEMGELIL